MLLLGVEIVDPVTFRVLGRNNFRQFLRRDMHVNMYIVHLSKNLLSFGNYFQYSCAISMNEIFQGNF